MSISITLAFVGFRVSRFLFSFIIFFNCVTIYAGDKQLGAGLASRDKTVTFPIYDFNTENPQWLNVVAGEFAEVLNHLGSDAVIHLAKFYVDYGLTRARLASAIEQLTGNSQGIYKVIYSAHPNARGRADFINDWFRAAQWPMEIEFIPDASKADPYLPAEGSKRIYQAVFVARFLVGPAVAAMGGFTGQSLNLPVTGTTALQMGAEGLFAVPALDRKYFSPFFKGLGFWGLATFNSAFGLTFWGCTRLLCSVAGVDPAAIHLKSFGAALATSAVVGLLFTSVYGQRQQDDQRKKETGRSSEERRYIGVSLLGLGANAGRFAAMVVPTVLVTMPSKPIGAALATSAIVGLAFTAYNAHKAANAEAGVATETLNSKLKRYASFLLPAVFFTWPLAVANTSIQFGWGEAGLVLLGTAFTVHNALKTNVGPRLQASVVRAKLNSEPVSKCLSILNRIVNYRPFQIR
jgi:hypothetical protein